MNNIFLPNDPLLYNSQLNDYRQLYEQKLLRDREQLDKQYNEYMLNISRSLPADKLSQLNSSIKSMSNAAREQLQTNEEFIQLNLTLLETVQLELVALVKNNINQNPEMVSNIDKQIKIIENIQSNIKSEEDKNMSEINDYIKNFSNMTFAEYKKLKNVGNE